jgi:hypothetical protein
VGLRTCFEAFEEDKKISLATIRKRTPVPQNQPISAPIKVGNSTKTRTFSSLFYTTVNLEMETMSTISVQQKGQAVNVRAQRILPTERLMSLK